jgi:tetratricopeptide (TPR) repeat protein
MLKLFFLAMSICLLQTSFAQTDYKAIDKQLKDAGSDSARGRILRSLYQRIVFTRPDSAVTLVLKHKAWFEQTHNQQGVALMLNMLSYTFLATGNYEQAVDLSLKALKIAEAIKDSFTITLSLNSTGISMSSNNDFKTAITYIKRSLDYAKAAKDEYAIARETNNIGDQYLKLRQPDSALPYLHPMLDYGSRNNIVLMLGIATGNFGEYYSLKKDTDMALLYYKQSDNYLLQAGDLLNCTEAYNKIAGVYFSMQRYDSTLLYCRKAVAIGSQSNITKALMDGYEWLYKTYEQQKNNDSAFKYLKLSLIAKDSLFSEEKTSKIQSLNFSEQVRQQDELAKQQEEEHLHRQNIETAGIGAGIILFIILFLLYSSSIIASPRLISALGLIALMITFEFFYLLMDRFLSSLTHESTLWMLLAWVLLAALLTPVDEFLDKWVRFRLVEKNKKKKITAAHKTLEELESVKPPKDDALKINPY